LHRLFPAGEEALACRVSLRCHVDSALLRSVSLIETALQCETVAENPRCQVPAWGLGDCRIRQTYSRRDVLGCSREIREKNGSTTSKKKTVTTPTFIPRVLDDSRTLRSKKPHPASAFGVRTKKHQEPLDKTGSFRDVAPKGRQCHPPSLFDQATGRQPFSESSPPSRVPFRPAPISHSRVPSAYAGGVACWVLAAAAWLALARSHRRVGRNRCWTAGPPLPGDARRTSRTPPGHVPWPARGTPCRRA
jgi:hypothetical protein